jgi:hypothetical protein
MLTSSARPNSSPAAARAKWAAAPASAFDDWAAVRGARLQAERHPQTRPGVKVFRCQPGSTNKRSETSAVSEGARTGGMDACNESVDATLSWRLRRGLGRAGLATKRALSGDARSFAALTSRSFERWLRMREIDPLRTTGSSNTTPGSGSSGVSELDSIVGTGNLPGAPQR